MPLSSDDAIEIELSDWLVNQDYVVCKQTRDSIVTKSAPVHMNTLVYDRHGLSRTGPSVEIYNQTS